MRILIGAGDVSGDVAGALLVTEILSQRPDAQVLGFGGPRMAAAGAAIRVRTSHLGVAGVTEVLGLAPEFVRAVAAIMRAVRAERPSVAVLIGNDLFSVLLGRWLRRRGVLTMSFFPPPTWMWGPFVRPFSHSFDVVLASFPDEDRVYREAGAHLRVEFVGHYLADRLRSRTADDQHRSRAALGLPAAVPVVTLMPGSRRDEVRRLMPVMAHAAQVLIAREPTMHLVVPVADERYRGLIEGELRKHGVAGRASVVPGPSHDAMIAADLIIVASGTASLETALLSVPMVIVYKVSPFTAMVARTFIRLGLIHKEMIGLPNLILGRLAVPELTQQNASGPGIADCAAELLAAGPRRQQMIADLIEARSRVAGGGALARAARVILESAHGTAVR